MIQNTSVVLGLLTKALPEADKCPRILGGPTRQSRQSGQSSAECGL